MTPDEWIKFVINPSKHCEDSWQIHDKYCIVEIGEYKSMKGVWTNKNMSI